MLSSACSHFSRSAAAKITVTINGQALEAKKGETIIQLADRYHIQIPRLCYHPCLALQGSCGMCVVQCKDASGKEILSNACVTKVANGMVIETKTQRVTQSVRDNLQQLLDVHDERCTGCVANNRCEFRDLTFGAGVSTLKHHPPIPDSIDDTTRSIHVDPSKCIVCGRCVRACKNVAGQKVLKIAQRGDRQCVQTTTGKELAETACVECGQCTLYCPVGAITEKSEYRKLGESIRKHAKKAYVVQVDPAAKVAVSDAFKLKAGTVSTGKIVAALKKLGFDFVFDSAFGCDLHAQQGAQELIEHLKTNKTGVLLTTTCPSFVKFVEQSRSELIPRMSTLRSPEAMLASLIRSTIPKKLQVRPDEVCNVILTTCTAKKEEIERAYLTDAAGAKDTDVVLTVREFVEMVHQAGIDFAALPDDAQFDIAYGTGSGAGNMYGTSGGCMEATLRSAYQILNGKKMPKPVIQKVRGMQAQKIAEVDLGTQKVKVAVVQGLANAMKLLDKIKKKDKTVKDVRFVEILSCPGGCVCGGGSPKPDSKEAMDGRVEGIYELDAKAQMKFPHENRAVCETMKELFAGQSGLQNCHEMLKAAYSHRPGF